MNVSQMTALTPHHCLFRLVMAYAFNKHEKLALDVSPISVIRMAERQWVLNVAMANGWVEVAKEIVKMPQASDAGLSLDWPLALAAEGGHIEAMREAKAMGAWDINWALAGAALGNQIPAMRLAKEWGANDVNRALANAAERGQLAAMREAKAMGATDAEWALTNAARNGHVEAMREARGMGAKDFNYARFLAADQRHLAAVMELDAWGAKIVDYTVNIKLFGGRYET